MSATDIPPRIFRLLCLISVVALMLGAVACGPGPDGEADSAERQAALEGASAENGSAPCAPGTECPAVNSNGTPNADGTSVAQCSPGQNFPDYIVPATYIPENFEGPWFVGSTDYPTTEPPPPTNLPWEAIDFKDGVDGANAYLYALRDYSFEGNIKVDFRVQDNPIRNWYTIPYMNYGPGAREFTHGLTKERTVTGPELGLKDGVSIKNYAIGFYNEYGGYATGQVWSAITTPDLSKAAMPDGTMVFKILFSDAVADDFQNPDEYPLAGSPEWQIGTGNGELTTVRLMQMDVAARDSRAEESGWVFGTFAFDPTATDPVAWNRLRPVGVQWGNAPGYTPTDEQNGVPLPENTVSNEIPPYAAGHLGWAGRVNGPVDNPVSACMSCHGTAQYPIQAAMAPFASNCDTDQKKLQWFDNHAGDVSFGTIDSSTCERADGPPASPLDFSLQMQVAAQNILGYGDVNPCTTLAPAPGLESVQAPGPRLSRDGTFARDTGE